MVKELEHNPHSRFGVKPRNLGKVIDRVADIYGEVTGRELGEYERWLLSPKQLSRHLKDNDSVEYRFGSTLTGHSKIWVEQTSGIIGFRISANMSQQPDLYQTKGMPMEERFEAEINKFLLESGFAEPLPNRF